MKAASATVPRDFALGDVLVLVKARLSLLVLFTTLVGFLLAWRGPLDWTLLLAALGGTALCACGAAALNQWWERDLDARMRRTRDRPLPACRMRPVNALVSGIAFSAAGVGLLAVFANVRASFLAFATIAIYILVYTPMKCRNPLNTLVGAVPGALPPLIGWVAARGRYDLEGCLLFAVLWFWQMPHFLAIAWMYRDDYARAGCAMITAGDPSGRATSLQAALYAVCLVVVTLLPAILGFNSPPYFFAALVLGAAFCGFALNFLVRRDRAAARRLFISSIAYLPLLLALLLATAR
jgi:protoheme IX farnesyltransferase